MIETRLSLAEARWGLQALGLEPSLDSPLRDPLAGQDLVPPASPAEATLRTGMASRGLLTAQGQPGPFLAAALLWLAEPEQVLCLSRFGPGGADLVHLALREGSAVECQRHAAGFRLRYPIGEAEVDSWLALRTMGGSHDR